ncbi:MAG: apolipoprotein N-acyltransferase [Helicobacter sp.]|nr:apolipoprotein N-acyltransferase [Helicobacter sp.]
MHQKTFLQSLALSLFHAVIFSLPITVGALFLSMNLDKSFVFINTFLAPLAFFTFLKLPRELRFGFGFFVGLILFYWIALSFRFSDAPYLIPIVMLAIALIYGVIFYILLWAQNPIIRAIAGFCLVFIKPFDFDWLFLQGFLGYSFFGVDNISFALILLACVLWIYRAKILAFIALLLAFFGSFFDYSHLDFRSDVMLKDPKDLPKINLQTTQVAQSNRWNSANLQEIINANFALIKEAIKNNESTIVLPETAFPIALNTHKNLMLELMKLSSNINIITGALRSDLANKTYNSTFIFEKGNVKTIDKVVLAPFGEYIPLPNVISSFLGKFLPEIKEFSQLQSAKEPQDFAINNQLFRNAICYEATDHRAFVGAPKYMIAISNNGWFYPSIEPFYQQILMKYYARKYGTTIFHTANQSQSFIISPSILGYK